MNDNGSSGNPPVTEARPIPLVANLAPLEKRAMQRINERLLGIIDENRKRPRRGDRRVRERRAEIDIGRSGRVLFIDGDRGTGKTSLLLTLLAHWKMCDPVAPVASSHLDYDEDARGHLGFAKLDRNLIVFLPVLDFDPLPLHLPLHGWLLQPWADLAARFNKSCSSGSSDEPDLLDRWHELFESAVVGWTSTEPASKGFVERALAYRKQTESWLDLPSRWRAFVDDVLHQCERLCPAPSEAGRPTSNESGSERLFIVAIDDVDLQVERLPELLHALRLLHHPNVVYVLTGHRDHLHDVMWADYARMHAERLGSMVPPLPGRVDLTEDSGLRTRLYRWSSRLADGLILKTLPDHAVFSVRRLTLKEVLELNVQLPGNATQSTFKELFDLLLPEEVDASTDPSQSVKDKQYPAVGLGSLLAELAQRGDKPAPLSGPLVTFRELQQAEDRLHELRPLGSTTQQTAKAVLRSLTGQPADVGEGPDGPLSIHRILRTVQSKAFRTWSGTQSSISVATVPTYEATSPGLQAQTGQTQSWGDTDYEINRAILAQLLVEWKVFSAPNLEWVPNAGPIWSELAWHPPATVNGQPTSSARVLRLVFNWPWLLKPKAHVISAFFYKFADTIRNKLGAPGAVAAEADVAKAGPILLAEWIDHNISFSVASDKLGNAASNESPEPSEKRLNMAFKRLEDCHNEAVPLRAEDGIDPKTEWNRFLVEIGLLGSPYFGLDDGAKNQLRELILNFLDGPTLDKETFKAQLREQESKLIDTALDQLPDAAGIDDRALIRDFEVRDAEWVKFRGDEVQSATATTRQQKNSQSEGPPM